MQHQITKTAPLLDENGNLREAGYAKTMLPLYSRSAIKAPWHRIKEWDYYYIGNDSYGVALTIADNSYMGLDSITFLDFNKPWQHTASPMSFLTRGKVNFPSTSKDGNVSSHSKNHSIKFEKEENLRILSFSMKDFWKGLPIEGRIELSEPSNGESMVIATPFKDAPGHFYFNQKINCMAAKGSVHFAGDYYNFDSSNSFGVLDWGRGVWTYKNTWYWASASGLAGDVPFGFNLGYGFGDTTAATENMIFYNHKAHKLEHVTFNIPKDSSGKEDYMSPWTFTSSDGRFEMDFVPIIDRHADTNALLIRSNQHQVFGKFSGKAILDDGQVIEIKDSLGFAEKVFNKW